MVEKILVVLNEKNITKKEFAKRLINLNPKVGMKAEPPSERTIYLYLQSKREIKADLVPFIAEVLNVTEQELFDTSLKTRKKCFKYFLQNASKEELEYFNNFINSQIHNNINIDYSKNIMQTKLTNEKIEEFSQLLKYAPNDFIDKVLSRLKEYKKIDNTEF